MRIVLAWLVALVLALPAFAEPVPRPPELPKFINPSTCPVCGRPTTLIDKHDGNGQAAYCIDCPVKTKAELAAEAKAKKPEPRKSHLVQGQPVRNLLKLVVRVVSPHK